MNIKFEVGGDRIGVSDKKIVDKPAVYIVGVRIVLDNKHRFCPLLVGETSKLKTRMEQYIDPFEMPGREIYDLKRVNTVDKFKEIYKIIKFINNAPVKSGKRRIDYINNHYKVENIHLSKMIFFNHHKYIYNYEKNEFIDFKNHGYLALCKQLYMIKDPRNKSLFRIKKLIETKLRIIDNFYFLYHYINIDSENILDNPFQYKNPAEKYTNRLQRTDRNHLARIRIESTAKKALENYGIHTSAKNEGHIGRFNIVLPKDAQIIFMEDIVSSSKNDPNISFY
jgi:hypothetical protein